MSNGTALQLSYIMRAGVLGIQPLTRRFNSLENAYSQAAVHCDGFPKMGILYKFRVTNDRGFYKPGCLTGKEDSRFIRVQRAETILKLGFITQYTQISAFFACFNYCQTVLFHLFQVFVEPGGPDCEKVTFWFQNILN